MIKSSFFSTKSFFLLSNIPPKIPRRVDCIEDCFEEARSLRLTERIIISQRCGDSSRIIRCTMSGRCLTRLLLFEIEISPGLSSVRPSIANISQESLSKERERKRDHSYTRHVTRQDGKFYGKLEGDRTECFHLHSRLTSRRCVSSLLNLPRESHGNEIFRGCSTKA